MRSRAGSTIEVVEAVTLQIAREEIDRRVDTVWCAEVWFVTHDAANCRTTARGKALWFRHLAERGGLGIAHRANRHGSITVGLSDDGRAAGLVLQNGSVAAEDDVLDLHRRAHRIVGPGAGDHDVGQHIRRYGKGQYFDRVTPVVLAV